MSMKRRIVAKEIKPLRDHVLVADMEFGQRITSKGIILPGDDMEQRGIKARWARVIAVGPKQLDVKPNDWILVDHGRWTRGLDLTDPDTDVTVTVRMVDPKDIFMSADDCPSDDYVRDKIGLC